MLTVIIIVTAVLYAFLAIVIGKVSYHRAKRICGCDSRCFCSDAWYSDGVDIPHELAAVIKGGFWPMTLLVWGGLATGDLIDPSKRAERKESKLETAHQADLASQRRTYELEEQSARHEAEIAMFEAKRLRHLK